MPSIRHEGSLLLLRARPEIVLDLLARATGDAAPADARLRVENAEFTQAVPRERRADIALVLEKDGAPIAAFVVEVQLAVDAEKHFAWPLYVASLHAHVRCATQLVVITPSRRVAVWARGAVMTFQPRPGAGGFLPLVFGPDEIPRIDDLDAATRMPELAALSALVHGGRADGAAVVETAVSALASLDGPNGAHYLDLVLSSLRPAARAAMEKLMAQRGYQYRVDWLRKANEEGLETGLKKGREEGARAEARRGLAVVLQARGITLSERGRARVETCEDVAILEQWMARAATIDREEELFGSD